MARELLLGARGSWVSWLEATCQGIDLIQTQQVLEMVQAAAEACLKLYAASPQAMKAHLIAAAEHCAQALHGGPACHQLRHDFQQLCSICSAAQTW